MILEITAAIYKQHSRTAKSHWKDLFLWLQCKTFPYPLHRDHTKCATDISFFDVFTNFHGQFPAIRQLSPYDSYQPGRASAVKGFLPGTWSQPTASLPAAQAMSEVGQHSWRKALSAHLSMHELTDEREERVCHPPESMANRGYACDATIGRSLTHTQKKDFRLSISPRLDSCVKWYLKLYTHKSVIL